VCVGAGRQLQNTKNHADPGVWGSTYDTDGMFYAASRVRHGHITDGLSNTAAFSECLLGQGPERFSGPMPAEGVKRVYAYPFSGISESSCASATRWNETNRKGFLWAAGEIRTTAYNHHYPPNPPQVDCIASDANSTGAGWHAARSNHTGGVNLMLGDGSGRFVSDNVDLAVWRGLSTRAGGEVVADF